MLLKARGCLQVSMVDGALLDALEGVARHVRRSDKPFGGIQLVLSGAELLPAHALPPVERFSGRSLHAAACQARLSATGSNLYSVRKALRPVELPPA